MSPNMNVLCWIALLKVEEHRKGGEEGEISEKIDAVMRVYTLKLSVSNVTDLPLMSRYMKDRLCYVTMKHI